MEHLAPNEEEGREMRVINDRLAQVITQPPTFRKRSQRYFSDKMGYLWDTSGIPPL
jgi:hypothetical protein